jgi:hypothetical protein
MIDDDDPESPESPGRKQMFLNSRINQSVLQGKRLSNN